jgi:hypothetical protein
VRRYFGTTRLGLGTSVGVWAFAFAVDFLVPLSARSVELTRCQDGYTGLNTIRVMLTVLIAAPTLLALWRAVRHLADDESPRWKLSIAAVLIALVAGATGAVFAMSSILEAGVPNEITYGGGC